MLKNQLIVISVTFYLACCSSVHPEFILSAYDKSHSILYQYTSCEFSSDSRNPDRDSILCIPSIHLGLETIYKKYSSIRLTKYRRKFNEEDDKRFIPNKYEYSSFQHSESQLRIANSKSIGSIDKNSFKSFITLSLKGDKGNCSLEQSVIFVFNKTRQNIRLRLFNYDCSDFDSEHFIGIAIDGSVWLSSELSLQSLGPLNPNEVTIEFRYKKMGMILELLEDEHVSDMQANRMDTRLHPIVVIFLIELAVLTSIAFVLLY